MDLRVSDPEREGRSLMCDLPMPRDGDFAGQSACGRNRTSQLGDGWRAFRKGYDMAKYVVKATKFRCGMSQDRTGRVLTSRTGSSQRKGENRRQRSERGPRERPLGR